MSPELAAQMEALHERFAGTGDPEDRDAFVTWLLEEGHIGRDTFRGLHANGELVLANVKTLATYYGTELGAPFFPQPDRPTTDELPVRAAGLSERAADRLTMLGLLARGAMGEVHIARDNELNRKIAVKRMNAGVEGNPNLAARFYAEAQITAQLDHPNIVPIYGLSQGAEGALSYSMKLIKGRTFAQLTEETKAQVDAGDPLDDDHSLSARIEYFLKVCDAVAYAHSRGVVHRDLKPENVMVGAFGEVYVMDWGIARVVDAEEQWSGEGLELSGPGDSDTRHLTQLGMVIGTPAYMSPEQAEGNNEGLDGRSDEFSLGLILFELLCLRPAVVGRDTLKILLKMQQADLEPATAYGSSSPLPPALVAILGRATAQRREDRYPGVKELADDLRRFQRGEEVVALPERGLQRVYRWAARHRELAMMLVSSVLVIALSTVVGTLQYNARTMREAEQREEVLADLVTVVADQAHTMDSELLRVEGLLRALAANALEALVREPWTIGPEGDSYFVRHPFSPPDLGASSAYERDVSIGWPVVVVGGDDRRRLDRVRDSLRQLTLLRQPLRRLLLQSDSDHSVGLPTSAEEELLRGKGTPIRWASVALENGLFLRYPGHRGLPPGFDARREGWYELAGGGERGPQWGRPQIDLAGAGLMLPCAMGLYDDDGRLQGAAGVELSADWVIAELLESPELSGLAEAYVLDELGQIVLQSSEDREFSDLLLQRRRIRLKRFDVPQVVTAVRDGVNGHVLLPDGDLVVYYRMDSMGWYYVIRGPGRPLLRGAGPG